MKFNLQTTSIYEVESDSTTPPQSHFTYFTWCTHPYHCIVVHCTLATAYNKIVCESLQNCLDFLQVTRSDFCLGGLNLYKSWNKQNNNNNISSISRCLSYTIYSRYYDIGYIHLLIKFYIMNNIDAFYTECMIVFILTFSCQTLILSV